MWIKGESERVEWSKFKLELRKAHICEISGWRMREWRTGRRGERVTGERGWPRNELEESESDVMEL